MNCSKQIKLKGGFTYTVRKARDNYECFYCGKPIRVDTIYIEETREPPRHDEWQLPYFRRAFADYFGDGR
jgi:5-methylcytosine-specific restriction endonuclease McrA